MAASELNNRLDYLISYSSQLVFVCSDKIQQQSHVIDSFLAQQNEQADLALLTANELTPLVIYREKLFRQLVSQTEEANFNLPLNQLLAPLNNHNGSILINIFQAEKLPNKLVKELWDLVLQSRFANNKQHINVLLMGLSNWAESAKSGLGAKSKDQPIVLNNQTKMAHTTDTETYEFSDLESYIQDKRKKFAQRIEERHEQSNLPQSVYKKGWVATLFGLVFVAIFIGILSWQYPQKINTVMSYFDNKISTPEQATNDNAAVEPTIAINVQPQALTQVTTPQNISVSMPMDKDISTKDLLITDWKTASAKLDTPKINAPFINKNMTVPISLEKEMTQETKQQPPVKDLAIIDKTVNDYQVEDIVDVAPIIKQSEIQLGKVEQLDTNSVINSKPEVLLTLPDGNFVIQVAAMANIGILQDYVKDEQLSQQLWLYKTRRYGGDWYVLLKNQHFSTIEGARAEISTLADVILKNTPFVKSIAQVKQEISTSES